MATVIVHATITLDGFMAKEDGGVDWMFGRPSAPEDDAVVETVMTQTIEDGEIPYGGMLKVPVYLMTHSAHEPIERDGTTYNFVVDDINEAVRLATQAAGDGWVSLLGGTISRQCLRLC
jgi:dihydrofolate reductase